MPPPTVLPRFHRSTHVELYPTEDKNLRARALGPDGPVALCVSRFDCFLRLPGSTRSFAGKMDTAAYVTVIPLPQRRRMAGVVIEPLTVPPGAPACWSGVKGIAGHRVPCDFGAVWMYVVDLQMRQLLPVRVAALFPQTDINEDQILLGTAHGVAEGRYFVARPDSDPARRGAWLFDQPPAFDAAGDISL